MKKHVNFDIIDIVKGSVIMLYNNTSKNTSLDRRFSNSKVVFSGVNYRITILSDRLIRLEYSTNNDFKDDLSLLVKNRLFNVPHIKVTQDDKYLVITSKYFILQYTKEKPFKGPKFAPDSNLKIKLINTDKLWYYDHPEARNFLGSAFAIEDLNSKTKLEKGLYSTDGFATLDDSKTMLVDEEGFVKQNDYTGVDMYLFMYKRDFGLCLKDYFTLTGFPPLLPKYALGIWWNRDLIYTSDDIKKLIKSFYHHKIPLSVLLLSEFWHNKDKNNYNLHKTGFTFNKSLFKDPSEFTEYVHNHGVRIGLNIDPCDGITSFEENYGVMAHELGVEKNETINLNLLDRKFVVSYFKNLIEPLYKYTDFFWIDYKNDIDNLLLLNYYHFKDMNRFEDRRGLLLSRNSLVASHNYPVHYSGETVVSWDTLKYLPFFNLTASNIGMSFWSHDVGGFKDGTENSELYIRYVEALTFSPIFRFSAKRGNFYKREPWSWDMLTFTIASYYCNLRQRLIPYIYTESNVYHENGIPLIEPLYWFYPEIYDEPLYKDEYFFGTELLVKPITKKMDNIMNRSVERIFLPKGVWYDFKTGKKFIGGKRYVAFYKKEDYPVFAKPGSIIPMSILEDNLNDTSSPKKMEIVVFPGKSNNYLLYEDDGITRLYEKGYYLKTNIEYKYQKDNFSLLIEPKEGKTGIIPDTRDYVIRFKDTRMPEKIELLVDGKVLSSIYDSRVEDNDLLISIKDISTKKPFQVNCMGKDIEIDELRIINEDINLIISDLDITTYLKERIASIIFSDLPVKKKRINIRKLKKEGLNELFIKMFLKLLEYIDEI